jgi:hypothetical protein
MGSPQEFIYTGRFVNRGEGIQVQTSPEGGKFGFSIVQERKGHNG